GDPACDLSIAWTFLDGESREAFRAALPLDAETWQRGRGWTLWKALIVFAEYRHATPLGRRARQGIDEVLADHRRGAPLCGNEIRPPHCFRPISAHHRARSFTPLSAERVSSHRPRGNPGPDEGAGEAGGTGWVAGRWRGWVMSPEDRALTE